MTGPYPPVLFRDRVDAGRKLGQRLADLHLRNPLILAIPSGGVPVGKEIAAILNAPFDVIIVRKIQYPWTTEAGFGAVASDGTSYLGPGAATLSPAVLEAQVRKAQRQVEHRERVFRQGTGPLAVTGKTVVLTDDGLATGSTMLAAVRSVRKRDPDEVVVAVPTTSGGAVELLRAEVGRLVSLYVHPKHLPFAVAASYEHWHDLTEQEVESYLSQSA